VPQNLIALLRERYWITSVRNLVKTVIHQCLTCYRFKAQSTRQLMGEMPSARVKSSRPFLTTVVDYAGPISLSLGPPPCKTITKDYIAMFVCFLTRAFNTEIVTSLSKEAFLAALRRFIARREKPRTSFRQWYQLSKCCQRTSCNLQNASIHFTDGNSTGLLGH